MQGSNRDADAENRCVDGAGWGEQDTHGRATTREAAGELLWTRSAPTLLCDSLERGEVGGRLQEAYYTEG